MRAVKNRGLLQGEMARFCASQNTLLFGREFGLAMLPVSCAEFLLAQKPDACDAGASWDKCGVDPPCRLPQCASGQPHVGVRTSIRDSEGWMLQTWNLEMMPTTTRNAMQVTGRFDLRFWLLRHFTRDEEGSCDRKQRRQKPAQEAAWLRVSAVGFAQQQQSLRAQ